MYVYGRATPFACWASIDAAFELTDGLSRLEKGTKRLSGEVAATAGRVCLLAVKS